VIVSLCDKSGVMLRPWAESGHDCIAVDIQHSIRRDRTEGGIRFVWGDVRSWTPPRPPAMVFAFPPCTDLAVSGARDFVAKGGCRLADALAIAEACHHAAAWSGAPWMIENPVGRLSTCWRKPDSTFDPCDYAGYRGGEGDVYTKKTCIWHGGGFVMPRFDRRHPTEGSRMHLVPPGDGRADARSLTPAGFARAVFEANKTSIEKGAA